MTERRDLLTHHASTRNGMTGITGNTADKEEVPSRNVAIKIVSFDKLLSTGSGISSMYDTPSQRSDFRHFTSQVGMTYSFNNTKSMPSYAETRFSSQMTCASAFVSAKRNGNNATNSNTNFYNVGTDPESKPPSGKKLLGKSSSQIPPRPENVWKPFSSQIKPHSNIPCDKSSSRQGGLRKKYSFGLKSLRSKSFFSKVNEHSTENPLHLSINSNPTISRCKPKNCGVAMDENGERHKNKICDENRHDQEKSNQNVDKMINPRDEIPCPVDIIVVKTAPVKDEAYSIVSDITWVDGQIEMLRSNSGNCMEWFTHSMCGVDDAPSMNETQLGEDPAMTTSDLIRNEASSQRDHTEIREITLFTCGETDIKLILKSTNGNCY